MKYILCQLTSLTFLASCGSSGPIDQTSEVTLLDSFSDGSAVVRVVSRDRRIAPAAISSNNTISTARLPSQNVPAESPFDILVSDLDPLVETPYGQVFSGTVVLNGSSYDVRMFTDNASSTELISALDTALDEKYTIVRGDQVSNIPIGNAVYTYTGQNLVSATNNSDFQAGGGTFSVSIKFSDMSGTITASSEVANATLTGDFSVDQETGYFSGENLVLNAPNLPPDTAAIINGSFHGDGAIGISALYYDASDTPRVNGAIIGSQSNNSTQNQE